MNKSTNNAGWDNTDLQALKESEARFRSIVLWSPDAIIVSDAKGKIEYINPAAEKFFNRKMESFTGKDFGLSLIDGETTEIDIFRPGKDPGVGDMHVVETEWLNKKAHLIIIRDITERKLIQEALRENAMKYRALFETANDAILLFADGKWDDCNEGALKVFGCTREQIIGQDPTRFSPPTQPDGRASNEEAFKLINLAYTTGPQFFEWTHCRADGTPFAAEVSLNRLDLKGKPYIQAIVRDISDRKQAAEKELELAKAREIDRLKSLFIASMSHELRTPLNSIIGFSGIVLQGLAGELNDEQKKQIGMIKSSGAHLLALVNDVIDVTKIEAEKIQLTIEEFDLARLVREIRDSFAPALKEKGLTLKLDQPDKLAMKSDERRVKQIIMNLVSNAVKFTDKGSIGIRVAGDLPAGRHGGERISIAVKDTGMGIKAEDMGKLFKQFSRIIVPGQALREGTGLGLFLSQKLAGILGGKTDAASKFEQGSEFTLTLPIEYKEAKT